MKVLVAAVLLSAAAFSCVAQEQAQVPENAVVAIINGKKFTADQIRRIVEGSPIPQAQTMYERNPKDFLRAIGVLMLYTDLAVDKGLDKQSPYKEIVEFYRQQVLSNAALNEQRNSFVPKPEEQQEYYKSHVNDFREARVRMMYFPFSDQLSETAAKAKAQSVAGKARLGADFVGLAKENSEDPKTAGADFVVKPDSAQPPAQMKSVLLQSKAGTVTEPLRHDNGYYVFRVESVDVLPYEKVKDDIYKKIQDERFRDWQVQTQQKVSVQIQNEAFFKSNEQK